MAESSEHIAETVTNPQTGGATKSAPGRPSAEFYTNAVQPHPNFSITSNYYQERCLQLEGQLNDANRKNQQIIDELFQARKDLSQDKTELLINHQNEIARLKEESRDKIDGLKETYQSKIIDLEKKIDHLDREHFKKDLEYKTAQQSPGSQFVEQIVKKTPEFLETIGGVIGIIAGQRHGLGPVATYPSNAVAINSENDRGAHSTSQSSENSPKTSDQAKPEPLLEEEDQLEERTQTDKLSNKN